MERTFGVMINFRFYAKTDAVSCVCEGDKEKTSVDLERNNHRRLLQSSKYTDLHENIEQEMP